MNASPRIAVTGGCGSLGSAIVRHLLSTADPEVIYVLDQDEQGLFNLERELSEYADQLEFVLGDVRDQSRLEFVLKEVDDVFHTAALKHVPLGEANPSEVIETNTLGTRRLINAAEQSDVDRVLGVSTDKASQPTSVMGATKMLAERLLTAADQQSNRTTYGSVRLGNVVGTSGSVVRIFEEQIADGGPVTVTHPDMSRFMLSLPDAAEFIVRSLDRLSGGEIFVPKMDAVEIMDLAHAMIQTTTPQEIDPDDVDIDIIGIRPGERLHEQLLTDHEARQAIEHDDSYVVSPQRSLETTLVSDGGAELSDACRSDRVTHLSIEEITDLLDET